MSGATISNRVNAIPGFEWETRQKLTETMFDDSQHTTEEAAANGRGDDATTEHTALEQRVAALEDRLEAESPATESVFTDPALAHKVVHACMASEQIAEEEELRILRELIG